MKKKIDVVIEVIKAVLFAAAMMGSAVCTITGLVILGSVPAVPVANVMMIVPAGFALVICGVALPFSVCLFK